MWCTLFPQYIENVLRALNSTEGSKGLTENSRLEDQKIEHTLCTLHLFVYSLSCQGDHARDGKFNAVPTAGVDVLSVRKLQSKKNTQKMTCNQCH